ncbi:hypothetical protein [Stappia sp.]|jgi:hypothetical protein|uniref:hypothetical protein n=1 Tax=Stappia sp. TaxID=1870903 RepID=UPI003A995D51
MRQDARERLGRVGAVLSFALFSLLFFGTAVTFSGPLERSVAGSWHLLDEVSGKGCRLELRTAVHPAAVSAPAFRVDAGNCRGVLPGAADIAAWKALPEGGLLLVSGAGDTVAAFDVGELDGLISVAPSGVFLLLTPEHPMALSALIPAASPRM